MLYERMRVLADQVESGELAGAEAARALRELTTHRPDERCAQMVSYSQWLARVDETWTWALLTDRGRGYGGNGLRLVSNRFTSHKSNLDTVIDFSWWDPADVDVFGRALCAVAEIEQARRAVDGDDEG